MYLSGFYEGARAKEAKLTGRGELKACIPLCVKTGVETTEGTRLLVYQNLSLNYLLFVNTSTQIW